jgi:hypothetical protein
MTSTDIVCVTFFKNIGKPLLFNYISAINFVHKRINFPFELNQKHKRNNTFTDINENWMLDRTW